MQQGIFRGALKLTPEEKAGVGLLGILAHHQIERLKVVCVDGAYDNQKASTVELPIDMCRLLSNIDVNWDGELISKAVELDDLSRAISGLLNKSVQLIECREDDAARVKAAIKWRFDSYMVENKTLAFLQVCIGLEAVLGDSTYNGALTETLADRCSYLIGSNIKGRKSIKNNFKELYELRSKLVHGNVSELNNDQVWFLNWGRTILEYVIAKEIKHLNLGKS